VTRGRVIALRPAAPTRSYEPPDDAVVAACAAGERAARALLFERYVDVVYRFVDRMRGSDRDAVDDLVQATFLAAFRAAARYRRGGNVRAWLLGIAANVTRDYARREIRRKRALGVVAELPRAGELEAGDRHLLSRLAEAIEQLPHDLRAAFVLVDLEGERGHAAAAALGIPEGTLWRRVFHARKRLRATLGGGEP
jgi:RNA polymerase sigma-70 factor (ECF subfamily)